ncbi:MAG TPA: nucleotide exchange factor GrpE, partial [Nitriliruptorales bacterium]|nr:nucleotide exchange factor GrpE [Nitriliruptorales bacterium]
MPQPHHDAPPGEAPEQTSTADAPEHAPTHQTDQEVPVGDGHEELGETTTPQPDVDATDVEGGVLSGAEHVATVEADDADQDPRTRQQLLADLRAAEADRGEYLDALQRVQADFQNYRKRSMREGALHRDEGVAQVLRRLIDVLDDFQLAVLAAENARDVDSLRKGVELVYGKFVDAL